MLSPSPPNVGGLSRQSSCTASPASPDVLLIDQEQYQRPDAAAESTTGFVVQLRVNFRLQVVQTIDKKNLAPRSFRVRLSSAWDRRRSLERQFLGSQRVVDPTSTARVQHHKVQPQARPTPPFFSSPAVGRTARLAAIVAQRNTTGSRDRSQVGSRRGGCRHVGQRLPRRLRQRMKRQRGRQRRRQRVLQPQSAGGTYLGSTLRA